ncbi:MAG: TlpA disulfide reductase family protein [Clostridia bacterium]|nr:TlpA disulfide reductase family protein [Clostridia bacterium]
MFKKPYNIFILIIVLSLLLTILSSCGGSQKLEGEIAEDDAVDNENESADQQPNKTQAPDFELTTLEGEVVKLSDYRGKVVMLNFWATWCGYCTVEMPEIQQAHEKYQQDLQVLAVNLTTSEKNGVQDVVDYIDKEGYTFTVPLDEQGVSTTMYGVRGIPVTYFIDKQGYVAFSHPGPMTKEQIEKYIQSLL